MGQIINVCTVLLVIACYFQVQGGSKYTDENRPYEFGFTIEGEQHRHEKKDENGIIMGEFGFITADGVYHVTVYATDENGNFKILSMKNIRVKPYPTAPNTGARQGHSLSIPSSKQTLTTQAISNGRQVKQELITGLAKSCSHCGVPTTTTTSPRVFNEESLLLNNKANENRNLVQTQSNNKYGSYEQNSRQNYSPQNSFGNNGVAQFTRTEQNNAFQITHTSEQYPQNIKKPAEVLDTPLTTNYLQNSDKQQIYQQNLGIKEKNLQVTRLRQDNSQSSDIINSGVQNYQQSFENHPQVPYTRQAFAQGSHSQSSNSQGSLGSSSEQTYPQMPSINAGGSAGQIYTDDSSSKTVYPYAGDQNQSSPQGLSRSIINGNINSDGYNEVSRLANPEHKYNTQADINNYPQTYESYPQDASIYSQGSTSLGPSAGQVYPQAPQSYQLGLISGTVSPGELVHGFKNDAFSSDSAYHNKGDLQNGQGKEISQEGNSGTRQPKNFDEILQSIFPENQHNSDGPKSIPSSQINIGELPKKPVLVAAQMQIVDKNTDIYHKNPGEEDGLPKGLTNNDMTQLLYTFNYTVGFHGHHEKGYTNGAKYGYYYVTGRNGIRTRVDYVADEKGFHPKITQEVLDVLSDEVPKPETEKDEKYGLKGYEFKWLYYPVESP